MQKNRNFRPDSTEKIRIWDLEDLNYQHQLLWLFLSLISCDLLSFFCFPLLLNSNCCENQPFRIRRIKDVWQISTATLLWQSVLGRFGRGMYLIRLLIVGDTGVGKTSLLIRFHEDQFIVHQKTTIGISVHLWYGVWLFVCSGVDYKAKEVKIENEMVKLQVYLILKNQNQFLQIWDTAGQERFRSMTSAFYNKAHGIILVFDVSQEESFRSLNTWIRDIRRVWLTLLWCR